MKNKQIWRLRAEFVSWAATITPTVWSGIPLGNCWIDGHSAYALEAELVSANDSTVSLRLPTGNTIPVALPMLGREERERALLKTNGNPFSPPEKFCA